MFIRVSRLSKIINIVVVQRFNIQFVSEKLFSITVQAPAKSIFENTSRLTVLDNRDSWSSRPSYITRSYIQKCRTYGRRSSRV